MNELAQTYMRNKLIVDMQFHFNWTIFIIVLAFGLYWFFKASIEASKNDKDRYRY
jgi:hypothetical protein